MARFTDSGAFTAKYAQKRIERGKWRSYQDLCDAVRDVMYHFGSRSVVDFGAGVGNCVRVERLV